MEAGPHPPRGRERGDNLVGGNIRDTWQLLTLSLPDPHPTTSYLDPLVHANLALDPTLPPSTSSLRSFHSLVIPSYRQTWQSLRTSRKGAAVSAAALAHAWP